MEAAKAKLILFGQEIDVYLGWIVTETLGNLIKYKYELYSLEPIQYELEPSLGDGLFDTQKICEEAKNSIKKCSCSTIEIMKQGCTCGGV